MQGNVEQNPLEALEEIKKVIQKSSRIFSLSGWSGIWAGLVGVATSIYIYAIFQTQENFSSLSGKPYVILRVDGHLQSRVWITAIVSMLVAILGAAFFTYQRNTKFGMPTTLNSIAQKLIINLAIPLFAGGIFCYVFILQFILEFIVPSTLVFYGLALINCSKYTFSEIKYLGLLELALGLISLFLDRYHLLIWAIGFGLLHIIYGLLMWYKYERKQ